MILIMPPLESVGWQIPAATAPFQPQRHLLSRTQVFSSSSPKIRCRWYRCWQDWADASCLWFRGSCASWETLMFALQPAASPHWYLAEVAVHTVFYSPLWHNILRNSSATLAFWRQWEVFDVTFCLRFHQLYSFTVVVYNEQKMTVS